MKTTWQVVRFGGGTYGVFKRESGVIVYSTMGGTRVELDDPGEAQDWCDKLNGKEVLIKSRTVEEFESMTSHVSLIKPIKSALRMIVVEGSTWKAAAKATGVTESGILRAMRRVSARNHP